MALIEVKKYANSFNSSWLTKRHGGRFDFARDTQRELAAAALALNFCKAQEQRYVLAS